MTTPKSLRLILVALCMLLVASLTASTSAFAAEEEKDVLLGSLPGLLQPCGSVSPHGLGFDQARGVLLVADGRGQTCPGEIKIFSAAGGAPVAAFNGSEGATKTPQGSLEFAAGELPLVGIAVDATGNVYVSDTNHHVVDKFEPLGDPRTSTEFMYVCQYSGPGRGCMPNPEVELASPSTFGHVSGLAIDQNGDLYVADPDNDVVDEFNATGGTVAQFTTEDHPGIGSPIGVAVDGRGDLFVLDKANQVVELQRSSSVSSVVTAEKPVPTAEPDVSGITFDLDSGLLLLTEPGLVHTYDPSTGKFSEEPGFPTPRAFNPEEGNLAIAIQETVGSATGNVYLWFNEERRVEIYGPAPPLKPAVSGESVAAVTSSSAQLSATVEPELRVTHYVFQYGPDQSYSDGELPAAPGGLVPGTQASAFTSVSLAGLTPGATYHYRVAATNKEGTAYGPDQTFTTFSLAESGLPDGRTWELVSPLEKNGGGIKSGGAVQASPNGEKITYVSSAAFENPQGNNLLNQYISTRGMNKWETENISPPEEAGSYFGTFPFQAFSSDLSQSLIRNGGPNEGLPITNRQIEGTEAPPGFSNFYVHASEPGGGYQALLTSPPGLSNTKFYMAVEAVTPDLEHIVEAGYDRHHPVQGRLGLNEWSSAGLAAVGVGLHGELVSGAVLGSGRGEGSDAVHALSADGSRVFWSVGGTTKLGEGSEPVFVRANTAAPESPHDQAGNCTVPTDACTIQLPPGEFVDASAQTGSKVLLSTGEVFDLERGERGERLADVTEGAGGFVGELGASEDLSRIYFIDTAVLPGAGANGFGATPRAGENNLYLYRENGAPAFIAALAPIPAGKSNSQDFNDWASQLSKPTRVTPDGETLLFQSRASVTGYDNQPAQSTDCQNNAGTESAPCDEVYVFHANTGTLACVSCNPTGQRPMGSAFVTSGNAVELETLVSRVYYQPRTLSADGSRVFFDSPEALVVGDKNGASDVYEYEDGHVHLISSGTGGSSEFVDASENGDNVFFTTANELVPGDTDQLVDLYDAKVDGGFPAAATEPACTGTGCQGIPAQPPIFATPSSGTFAGVGNFPAGLVAPPAPKKTAAQLRAEKLAKALKACHAKRGKKRALCEKTAHRKYGAAKKASARKAKRTGTNRRSS